MRRGTEMMVRAGFTTLLLSCLLLPAVMCLCTYSADARADFATWANRSTRSLEPVDYNTNGTSTCQMCGWKGTQGIGNVGIGNGSVAALTNGTTKDETLYPDYDLQGVVMTEGSQYPDVNHITGDAVSKALQIGGTPGVFTLGKPYKGILNEYPVESTAVYGKLTGLRMPDGRNVEIGVKSIGYEY